MATDNKPNRFRAVKPVKEGPVSYDDYAAIDDGLRYELANGVLELMSPAPSPVHQFTSHYMAQVLEQSCGMDYLFLTAPVDVILSNKEVRQPDIVAIHRNRVDIITRRGIEGVPDLAVEVVSPSSVKRDREQKLESYARHGIPEYWIISAEYTSLEQYILDGDVYLFPEVYTGDDVVQSPVLACVNFSVNDVLRRLPDLPNA
jgi:Uma2 family endonuclease